MFTQPFSTKNINSFKSHSFSLQGKRASDLTRSHSLHMVLMQLLNHILPYYQLRSLPLTWPMSTHKVARGYWPRMQLLKEGYWTFLQTGADIPSLV